MPAMLVYLRYALATLCLTASFGCLALWWRSFTMFDRVDIPLPKLIAPATWQVETAAGFAAIGELPDRSLNIGMWDDQHVREAFGRNCGRLFGCFYFSLWFPIAIFALAGVGALRLGRQFSIRSALIGLKAVAALLGMAVLL